MKITRVEVVRNREPIVLPTPWLAAWRAPDGEPVHTVGFSFYKVYTDEGIVGIGPYTGASGELAEGFDPFRVGAFWSTYMSGRRERQSDNRAAGLEVALWDIIGKAAGRPVHQLLGACRDRLLAYAATSRLLDIDEHVAQVLQIQDLGFRAVKLRLHRADPRDDLAMVQAVRQAVGEDMMILVDANQNNLSEGYSYWSRQTALRMARALDELGVYFMEEPLPRRDVEGLAAIAGAVDMFIAGGEHSPTAFDFKEHILRGAYDILQPDVILGGNMGITGLRKVAELADHFGRTVVPHVCSNGSLPISLAATLQAMATVENCPMVEYPFDPPILTAATTQTIVDKPLWIDSEGYLEVPTGPGLGIELDEAGLSVETTPA